MAIEDIAAKFKDPAQRGELTPQDLKDLKDYYIEKAAEMRRRCMRLAQRVGGRV